MGGDDVYNALKPEVRQQVLAFGSLQIISVNLGVMQEMTAIQVAVAWDADARFNAGEVLSAKDAIYPAQKQLAGLIERVNDALPNRAKTSFPLGVVRMAVFSAHDPLICVGAAAPKAS